MSAILASHRLTLILLASVAAGGALGFALGPRATLLDPLGDLFLNLLFMAVVPLVFFGIAAAVAQAGSARRLGRILGASLLVFAATSPVASLLGMGAAVTVKPVEGVDFRTLQAAVGAGEAKPAAADLLETAVAAGAVPDFTALLSRKNMLALVVFALLTGLSAALAGGRGRPFVAWLDAGAAVTAGIVDLIMYYAPVGLACFFASVVGRLGGQILTGYARVFGLYLALTLVYAGIGFPLLAWLAAGRRGVTLFLRHAGAPSAAALATCSSTACIPVNLAAARAIGVPRDVAETVLPLAANTHKDGSAIGGAMKIAFLFALFGMPLGTPAAFLGAVGVSFLVGAVMGGIPGGGMIGEMLILSVYGFPPEALPVIAVISTIIDAPATFLNSTGNLACAMLVARLVEGPGWRDAA